MKRDEIRAVYDRRAADYDRSAGRTERWLLGDFRQGFGAALAGDTLEVAIGSGLNLPYYTSAVRSAVGVDLSGEMLARARQRANDLGLPTHFVQADAQQLPFADATFDTVAVSLSLCTVPDPAVALRELARVCRPTGRVVFLEHVRSPVGVVAIVQSALTPLQERLIGCHLTRQTIDLARRLGFTIADERQRVFGVVRLAVAHPPAAGRA